MSGLFDESLERTSVLVERAHGANGHPIHISWANDTLSTDSCDREELARIEEVSRGGGGVADIESGRGAV